MITVENVGNVYDLRGLSSDTKPTENIGNGSTFFEMDKCEVYIFDKQNKQWIKL